MPSYTGAWSLDDLGLHTLSLLGEERLEAGLTSPTLERAEDLWGEGSEKHLGALFWD